MSSKTPYPRNWKRASRTMRRVIGRCERCGAKDVPLSVHHRGLPYADGKPGNPHDKRDLRRENLQVLCLSCHWVVDLPRWKRHLRREQQRERHAALGVGTGVVLYQSA